MTFRLASVFEREPPVEDLTREALITVFRELASRNFDVAKSHATNLASAAKSLKLDAQKKGDCSFADAAYAASRFLSSVLAMVRMWEEIYADRPRPAWDLLQDSIEGLRWTSQNCEDASRYFVDSFVQQLSGVETMYPFRIFSSIEVIAQRSRCSLCNRPPLSLACPHIPGEVYCGEMALVVHEDLKFLAVSLVPNPDDKRCVIEQFSEGAEMHSFSFAAIHALPSNLDSPLRMVSVVRGRRVASKSEFGPLGDLSPCPCLSGKGYSMCCKTRATIEVPHLYVTLGEQISVDERNIT